MKNQNICKFPISILTGTSLSIICFVRETNKDVMHPPQKLTAKRMLLCDNGSGTAYINDTAFPLSQGTLLFLFGGETLSVKNREDLTYLYIDFEGERGEELLRRFDITPLSRLYDGFDGLIPLWQESLFRSSDRNVELAAESILLYTFSRLSADQILENGLMGQILRLTEQNFTDPTLSISSIADELSYNPKYLSHVFKKRAKISYSEYLRAMRIKYSTMLFDHGIDSVKNAAFLSGFSDPFYFSNVFKKVLGTSPKDYIEGKRS